jgi:hypothetical protein
MSGGKTTGEYGHRWADAIGELVGAQDEPVEIRLREEPEPYQRKLIEALGGRVVVDAAQSCQASATTPSATSSSAAPTM